MTPITSLPCEVIAGVLRKLDHVQSLLPSVLTCQHFYSSYKESPSLALDILQRQVGPALLPYSIALSEASRMPKPRSKSSISQLLDTLYNDPHALTRRARDIPFPALMQMGRTHDLVKKFANEFASDAWLLLGQSENLSLSSAEQFRLCRAFYRTELFLTLFWGDKTEFSGVFVDERVDMFFSRHPPWVNEQLGCVHDYLEQRFSKATLDTISHDIELGELSIDYITNGPLNASKQIWISLGIDFINQLENTPSHEAQQALLISTTTAGRLELHDSLSRSCETNTENENNLEDFSDEELKALVPKPDEEDTDEGPFIAWHEAHLDTPHDCWVLLQDNASARRCAYVFWDAARVAQYNLLQTLDKLPSIPQYPSHEEFLKMQHSFNERSRLWQKGGKGYWNPSD
ncbi:hypothetical protein F4825DRAFT_464112 [Nemania diffusa]|nr:hypothetical protein F4825DRAFT_464112 [Nemania diffusa]